MNIILVFPPLKTDVKFMRHYVRILHIGLQKTFSLVQNFSVLKAAKEKNTNCHLN